MYFKRMQKKLHLLKKIINASNILKENLIKLSIEKKSKIFNDKIENVLNKKIKEKFNIFFLDPPFADKNFLKNLEFD